ncbi:MAG TPA: DUF3107 domain-containing protein, partial [Nocardioidaceae bacterium]|nr:DUF3107 domain-containing protein [Nocardioidaceae bacterium]
NVARELTLETDQSSEDIEAAVTKALSSDEGAVTLTDTKGRKLIVPTTKLAYVELGSPTVGQVGFRS